MVQSQTKYYRPGRIVENLILERGRDCRLAIICANGQMPAVAQFAARDQVHLCGIVTSSELDVGLIRSSPQLRVVRSIVLRSFSCGRSLDRRTVSTSVEFLSPIATSSAGSTSISAANTAIVPIACTPSISVYSLGPQGGTFSLNYVTATSGGNTWTTTGSDILNCSGGASSGGAPATCSATAPATIAAGSIITLTTPAQTSGNTSGVFIAFSCY